MSAGFDELVADVRAKTRPDGVSWAVRGPDGEVARLGSGEPVFEVQIHNDTGMRALKSFNELAIAEAYMRDDIDFDGDFLQVMELRHMVKDRNALLTTWAHVSPLILGRKRLNPKWIAKHYDMNNLQTICIDENYSVYTPGIYDGEDDTLEAGAERKLDAAFTSLGLGDGMSLLDVGCGWGGMLRFSARRGVQITGITLSRDQLGYTKARLEEEGLKGTVLYQDFFTFEPGRRYDAISLMGVFEDLSDYDVVMKKLRTLLAPGGRVYADFASANRKWGIASIVTKHIWPGKFRMVYMPEFTEAVAMNGFEMLALHNDRINYHLWTKKAHERWMDRHDEVLAKADEATWRLMRMLQAGVSHSMGPTTVDDTAYRVVLGWRQPPAA
jgi:cyclopropane-fatty-acyl-phospholipid synthase